MIPIRIAVVGATGVVGQKVIALLANNPHFQITELVASDQRIGQIYAEACTWREPLITLPKEIAAMKLSAAENLTAEFVISALPTEVANSIEPLLAKQGKIIFSNAATFRMDKNVPLLVPEINLSHLSLLAQQTTPGKIITNPNCSAVGITLALAPLQQIAAINHVGIVTMQSISGAGYPGVPAFDILGNTIPHINEEAEKITLETKKILGQSDQPAAFAITTQVHRVPVVYGHSVTLQITFQDTLSAQQAKNAYIAWNQQYSDLFVLHQEVDRPQSTKDLRQDDMRIHIGQLRQGDLPNLLNLVTLSHNLVRGAAGAAITNMQHYLRHYHT